MPTARAHLDPRALPGSAPFDDRIDGEHPPASNVRIRSRDRLDGEPLTGATYSICYANAFQT